MSGDGKNKHPCNICAREFDTVKGLLQHASKSHKEDKVSAVCEYCKRTYENLTKLHTHYRVCKEKRSAELQPGVEIEKHKQEAQRWKEECEKWKQKYEMLKEVKDPQAVLKNCFNINNISNNLVINMPRSNASRKPITNDFLKHCFDETMDVGIVTNATEMAERLFNNTDLQHRVVKTDSSRLVIKWVDGDENNTSIRDPQGKILAKKTLTANRPKLCNLHETYLNKYETHEDDPDIKREYLRGCAFVQDALCEKSNIIDEFGTKIGKLGHVNPACLPPCQSTKSLNRLAPFVDIIVEIIMKSPYMMFHNPDKLGSFISVYLQPYRVESLLCDNDSTSAHDQIMYHYNGINIPQAWFEVCFMKAIRTCFLRLGDMLYPTIPSCLKPALFDMDDTDAIIKLMNTNNKTLQEAMVMESERFPSTEYFKTLLASL